MRVYLDTCVLQDLKTGSNKPLLESIIQSKGELIYCFSEAHIDDLVRDKTDEKFADMAFMEQIVDDNCLYHNKGVIMVDNFKPVEFYNRFDWTNDTSVKDFMTSFTEEDVFGGLLKSLLSAIPLNFKDFIPQGQQLPNDVPQDLADMLVDPSNMYEFMQAITMYLDTLSGEQKKFKEQLQYLHKNQLTKNINLLKIDGYDENTITDKEKFRDSYANYYLKNTNGKDKYRYDLFLDMYSGLEFLGLVQGKPRKQKMMNMINDGKHAFFGGFCDVVVSKDHDFINKAKFMYNLQNIDTQVYDIADFTDFLKHQRSDKRFSDLASELVREDTQENIMYEVTENGQSATYQQLSETYYGYFNTLINHSNGYIYFTKQNNLFGTGTLIKEISFCVNKLFHELGLDCNSRGEWVDGEITKDTEKDWHGRVWQISDKVGVELNFTNKLYLTFWSI